MYESRFFFFFWGGAAKGEGYFDFWSAVWSVWVIRGWLDESACGWGKGLDWNGIWGEGCAAGHALKTKMSTLELKGALFISGVLLHITKSSIFFRWRDAEEPIRQSAPTHTHMDTLPSHYTLNLVQCWASAGQQAEEPSVIQQMSQAAGMPGIQPEIYLQSTYPLHTLNTHCPLPACLKEKQPGQYSQYWYMKLSAACAPRAHS